MTRRKTTPQERESYIKHQNALGPEYGYGPGYRIPGDVSFIDRKGQIVHVHRKYHDLSKGKRRPWTAKEERGYDGGLANKTFAILGIAGILAGLFFLSSNITGNAIGNFNQTSTNLTGGVLLVIGLIGAFAYFRKK